MSSWDDNKIEILRQNWGKMTASALAEKIGGVTRNAVIGKAHRLNLSAKIKKRSSISFKNNTDKDRLNDLTKGKRTRKQRFQSLLLDKNFEPAKNLSLEQLTDENCKYAESDPDKPDFSFCGRKTVGKFSYCPLHLMMVFQPKGKKEDIIEKDEVPQFIEKKIKSA